MIIKQKEKLIGGRKATSWSGERDVEEGSRRGDIGAQMYDDVMMKLTAPHTNLKNSKN